MDPNDVFAGLTPQQILQLANFARTQLMQQGHGPYEGQVLRPVQPQSLVPVTMPENSAYNSGYGAGLREGMMAASEGAQASNADTDQAHSPPHAAIDIEATSPPQKINPHRRAAASAKRKGKAAATEQEAARSKQENFAPLEDRLLVTSWLEISCDPLTNTGQDNLAFWTRITNLYNSKRGSYPLRSLRSLQSRYDFIKKPVAKFASYYADVVRRNPSGMSDADKTSLACAEFASVEPKPFKFMHVWDIMKDNPKFMDTKQGRNFRSQAPSNWEDQLFDPSQTKLPPEITCPTPSSTTTKRPMGRDAAKRGAKRSCPNTPTGSDFAQSIQALVTKYDDNQLTTKERTAAYMAWKKEQEEEARQDRKLMIELEREKLAIEKQKLKLKEKQSECEQKRLEIMYTEQEERILSLDLSTIPEPLRSYYKKKQRQIIERTDDAASHD